MIFSLNILLLAESFQPKACSYDGYTFKMMSRPPSLTPGYSEGILSHSLYLHSQTSWKTNILSPSTHNPPSLANHGIAVLKLLWESVPRLSTHTWTIFQFPPFFTALWFSPCPPRLLLLGFHNMAPVFSPHFLTVLSPPSISHLSSPSLFCICLCSFAFFLLLCFFVPLRMSILYSTHATMIKLLNSSLWLWIISN